MGYDIPENHHNSAGLTPAENFIKPRKVAIPVKSPLENMLDQHNDATFALSEAQQKVREAKRALVQYAVENQMFDAISVNVYRLRRIANSK